jgi:D-aminoacyl-tRNA deacylase
MRAVVQRVLEARVEVAGENPSEPQAGASVEVVGAIGRGLVAYLGFGCGDDEADRAWILTKIASMRLFDGGGEHPGRMSRSVGEVGGAILLISQFTLYADVRRGRRPSFDGAMRPELAREAYEATVREARTLGVPIQSGRFQAHMRVHSVNDGPVTIWLDSRASGRAPHG